jgi:two-component system sensor histidine kinase ArlS
VEKETGNLEMPLANPREVIGTVTERFMSLHPDFEAKLDLVELDGVALMISMDHLEQILLILLDNAVKYSPCTKMIGIRAALDGQYATLAIEDRGIGIPARDLPYVTERFYRVDKARGRNRGGNGLGLAIAKRLVERNQGKLVIQSREHEGTTVTVYVQRSADGATLKEESP